MVPILFGKEIQIVGVEIFFSISGYLVAASWNRSPCTLTFLIKRALRIFPALAMVCFLSVFVVGPTFSSLDASSYFSNPATFGYFSNLALYIVYTLPGLFEFNPFKSIVNGSLWSLPVEFAMYLTVVLTGMVASRYRQARIAWLCILIAAIATKIYFLEIHNGPPIVIWATSLSATVDASVYFFAGAFLANSRSPSGVRPIILITVLVLLIVLPPALSPWLDPLLLAYLVIAVGRATTPGLRAAGRWGDFSYGLYLYAFPVQQIVMQMKISGNSLLGSPLVFMISILLAALSWHCVEKPALAFKPGRARATNKLAAIKT